ncbi:DNA-binding response regulator [Roseivirga sp.]|uniref:response regulator transcription factor n=1 Tax=Roseivirga sp. TaxID=1964215 RepID=UPI003B52F611
MNTAIYDPQFLTREGVRQLLEQNQAVQQTHILNTEKNLEEQLNKLSPSLLVIEYKGQQNIQAETLERIRTKLPQLKTLIISEDDDPLVIRQYINQGIEGFITKQCSNQEVKAAIDTVIGGGKFYCERVIDIITHKDLPNPMELSDREMQVIRYVAKGFSSEDIAAELNVSIHTVNSHRKNVLKKLGLKSPTELIVYALRQGWVTL